MGIEVKMVHGPFKGSVLPRGGRSGGKSASEVAAEIQGIYEDAEATGGVVIGDHVLTHEDEERKAYIGQCTLFLVVRTPEEAVLPVSPL